ncbi:FHA domain-containing protein [uncultured Clostridium sp.]|uniref:FHA domain-containing protein n=1 Tax=uncultured Clostridium sp. TaxID=59620 RepID=UPI0025CE3AA2|nr:FHA domain-containing protein [uncultured Clostridium sp.]
MSFSKMSAVVFGIAFIIILYVIIYYALKIMYKDVKGGGRRRTSQGKKSYGIEVMEVVGNSNLKKGAVVPIRGIVTIGRKNDNSIVLSDQHVSSNHARFVIKNNILFIEDLNSTNGTYVNGKKVEGKVKLFGKDEIKIGSTSFMVL